MNAIFIVLEGIDGSGKTTQAERLSQRFREQGREVLSLKEPGGTPLGDQMRQIFLHSDRALKPLTELLLIEASRHELVQQVIGPGLSRGAVVVCQRYTYSSLAYQGYGRGLPLDWINQMNEQATGGLRPHLAVYLDVPVDEAVQRVGKRRKPDRLEREGLEFLQKVDAGYRNLLKQNPEMVRVDGTGLEEEITKKIAALLDELEGGNGGLHVQKG